MRYPIVLLNDFNMEFDHDLIYGSLVSLKKEFLIETNKRKEKDFNRYSLELRMDPLVISWFVAYYRDQVEFAEFDPAKEDPVIVLEEGTTKEILLRVKKK